MEARDRKVIEILLKLGSVFGVCPIGSLTKIDATRSKTFTVLLLTLSTATCTLSLYFNARDNYANMTQMDMFVDLLSMVFNALEGTVIIMGPLFTSTIWKKLLLELQSCTQWNKSIHKTKEQTVQVYTELVIFHVMFVARFSWDAYVWITCRGINIYKNYFYRAYHEYCAIISILLMVHFNFVIQNHFRLLNIALWRIVNNYWPERQKGGQLCLLDAGSLNKLNMNCELRAMQRAYRKLTKMVEHFNRIFGYQILLLMGYTVAVMLGGLHNALTYNNFKEKIDAMILSWSVISGTIIVVKAVAIIISCDATTRETRKIVKLCHKLQEDMPLISLERNEMLNLITLAKNIKPSYTAADFFIVDRTTLFKLLSVSTSYFIIIIQFNLQPK